MSRATFAASSPFTVSGAPALEIEDAASFVNTAIIDKKSFDLITKEIALNDGVWIGAKSIILPGVIADSHAILSAGSVISKNLESFTVYKGNPAEKVGSRTIS